MTHLKNKWQVKDNRWIFFSNCSYYNINRCSLECWSITKLSLHWLNLASFLITTRHELNTHEMHYTAGPGTTKNMCKYMSHTNKTNSERREVISHKWFTQAGNTYILYFWVLHGGHHASFARDHWSLVAINKASEDAGPGEWNMRPHVISHLSFNIYTRPWRAKGGVGSEGELTCLFIIPQCAVVRVHESPHTHLPPVIRSILRRRWGKNGATALFTFVLNYEEEKDWEKEEGRRARKKERI